MSNNQNSSVKNLVYAGVLTILSIPTPEMYSGDFRNWVDASNRQLPIYDPRTTRSSGTGFVRDPYPNNQIPVNTFSKTASAITSFAKDVAPNRGGVAGTSAYVRNNYIVTSGTNVTPTDKWSIKGDQMIGKSGRCKIKARKEDGTTIHLVAACATDIMFQNMQFSLKELDANSVLRLFPGMEGLELKYGRCPAP